MPYIPPFERPLLDLGKRPPTKVGQLNYVITRILNQYVLDVGLSYLTLNEVIGALECAKQEFYRRVVSPHEDRKKEANGDVYTIEEE